MSTVVCRGLQSCLEPQLTETRTLRLKLALPKPSCSLESNISSATEETKTNPDLGGWVFLQSLSNSSQTSNKEIPYVHPMLKPSSSNLSDKSLELCTENLGSETGTEITETSNISLSYENSNAGKSPTRESRKVKNNSLSFPPPLTTMTGLNPLQVRPHREGGRLIITAVETTTSPHTYFQAERSQGRLRLSLWKECNNCSTSSTTTFDMEENEDSDMEEHENETNDEEKEEGEEFEEEDEEEEKEEEEESDVCVRGEDMDGDSLDGGVEMGMEKFRRPNRCNDGGNNNSCLGNWEPFWVPIS